MLAVAAERRPRAEGGEGGQGGGGGGGQQLQHNGQSSGLQV